jgi:hypothetical protein
MKLKITPSIPELLRQLPEGSYIEDDAHILRFITSLMQQLRAMDDAPTPLLMFTTEVRQAFAVELTAALAQIIKARIPRNARGTVNKRVGLEREWEEKRAAKALIDAERKELQDLKRANLEMREGLEKFEAWALGCAAREPVGAPPDASQRHERMDPALDALQTPLDLLQCTPVKHPRLKEQITAMDANWEALTESVNRWCAVNAPAAGKAAGVHKGKALADWLEACKKLGRDIAEELRNLK